MSGALLAPWPNRISDGRYSFAGRTYQLRIDDLERRTADHGLVSDLDFTLVGRTESTRTMNWRYLAA
jgi:aldose 1-epimerase